MVSTFCFGKVKESGQQNRLQTQSNLASNVKVLGGISLTSVKILLTCCDLIKAITIIQTSPMSPPKEHTAVTAMLPLSAKCQL